MKLKLHIESKKISAFVLFYILTSTLFAQLSIVKDARTNIPLPDVILYSADSSVVEFTNEQGHFITTGFLQGDTIFLKKEFYCDTFFVYETNIPIQIFMAEKTNDIYEVVVSASKFNEKNTGLPFSIDVIDTKHLKTISNGNTADKLSASGNIHIQKSQAGGGSPVLRGFEANRVLLVVDGIRMNNAIYRNGHLQNAITIDGAILDKTEIIYGPMSVMYGSDAIGGICHFITKKPEFADNGRIVKGELGLLWSPVNNTRSYHGDITIGGEKLASLTSITINKYGNIITGKNRGFLSDEDFGLHREYATKDEEGQDIIKINADPNEQKNTSYDQYDILQKFSYKFGSKLKLHANLQYSTSSNINRFDMLTDHKNNALKYAEWYYGPQNRALAAIQAEISSGNRFFNSAMISLSFQDIQESRYSRKYRDEIKIAQVEDVQVYAVTTDFRKYFNNNSKLNYGIDMSLNNVESGASATNIYTGSIIPFQTRYPDGGSKVYQAGLYSQLQIDVNEKIRLLTGARYHIIHLGSLFNDTSFVRLPFDNISILAKALTGSSGFLYSPAKTTKLHFTAATGFRAPNVDDYGKVRAKSGLITIPSDGLQPEQALNFEIGATQKLFSHLTISIAAFQTYLWNAITRADYSVNGTDSILYAGDHYKMITNINKSRAEVKGIAASVKGKIKPSGSVEYGYCATINYTKGESENEPMGHIPPTFGKIDFSYRYKKIFFQAWLNYQFMKHLDDCSPWGEDNTDKAQSDGFPGWYTCNFMTSFDIKKKFSFSFFVYNIFDQHYRTFASGLSNEGRNIMLSLKAKF